MSLSDWVSVGGVLASFLGVVWAIAKWSIDRYAALKEKLQTKEDESIKNALVSISHVLDKLDSRVEKWEQIQSAQATASMQQFHALELAMKGYASDIQALNKSTDAQFKHWAAEVDRIWKTVVTEIRPGVFRVSDKNGPKKP